MSKASRCICHSAHLYTGYRIGADPYPFAAGICFNSMPGQNAGAFLVCDDQDLQHAARCAPAPEGPTRATISPGMAAPPLPCSTCLGLCVAVSSTEQDSPDQARSQGLARLEVPILSADCTTAWLPGGLQRSLCRHGTCLHAALAWPSLSHAKLAQGSAESEQ